MLIRIEFDIFSNKCQNENEILQTNEIEKKLKTHSKASHLKGSGRIPNICHSGACVDFSVSGRCKFFQMESENLTLCCVISHCMQCDTVYNLVHCV